jgi:hypothetical protein
MVLVLMSLRPEEILGAEAKDLERPKGFHLPPKARSEGCQPLDSVVA